MSTAPLPLEFPISKRTGRRWAWVVLVLVFGAHSFQAFRLFPGGRSIVDPVSPVIVVDHAIHEYHGSLGARFFRETGTTWGYDPYFMAGYPETPVWDSSSNLSILFDLIDGGRGYRAYKLGLLALSILLLAAIAGGAWAVGLGAAEVAVASVLAWLFFWTTYALALWRSGLFAFISTSAGVGLLLGLCLRFDRSPSRRGWLAVAATGSVLLFAHVTTPIMVMGGLLGFLASVAWRHGWRWSMGLLGAATVAVAVNSGWLALLWRFRGIRSASNDFNTADSARFLLDYFLESSTNGRCALVLLILGTAGLATWWFGGRRPAAATFGGAIIALILLAGFGSLWGPTRVLEPVRFCVAFNFLLTVPAASAVVRGSSILGRRLGGGLRGGFGVVLVWAVILGAWGVADHPFFRAVGDKMTQHRPLVVGLSREMRGMVDWLKANTDLSARILFEDQLRLLETTDPESVHWTPLLPLMLGPDSRLFLGGLYHAAFIHHHRMASFGDFHLGNRPIDEWPPSALVRYCEAYNVGWVVCWSPLSRFWIDRYPGAKRVATLPRFSSANQPISLNEHEWKAMILRAGLDVAKRYMTEGESNYAIYRIERAHSYFLQGQGRIVAVGPNRVELADVRPDKGAVVISLHWLETWKTDPPLTLRPEPIPPDPVDFVRIEMPGPAARVVLYNGDRAR